MKRTWRERCRRSNRCVRLRNLRKARDRVLKETNHGVAARHLDAFGVISKTKEWGGFQRSWISVRCEDGWSGSATGGYGEDGLIEAIHTIAKQLYRVRISEVG